MRVPRTRRESEIWQACDDLLVQGFAQDTITFNYVTNRVLELGYLKGNPKQTYDYIKTWKQNRPTPSSQDQTHGASSTLTSDPITRAVTLVREELQAEATEQINQIKEAALKYEQTLQAEHDEIKAQLQEIAKRLSEKEKTLNELNTKNHLLEKDLREEKQAHQLALTQIATQEKWLDDFKVTHEKHSAQINASHQAALTELRKEMTYLRQSHYEETNHLKTEIETHRHHFISEKDHLKTTLLKVENENKQFQLREKEMKKQHETLTSQVEKQTTLYQALQVKWDALQKQHINSGNALVQKDSEIQALKTQIDYLQFHLRTLEEAFGLAKDKMTFLERQNASLKKEKIKVKNQADAAEEK